MHRFPLASAVLLFVWCSGGILSAQSVPARTLATPEARLDREWSRIVSLHERSDGSVIVLDNIENVIVLVNSGMTTARQIGREGQGPGEFFNPSTLLAIGGDSTGVVDHSSRSLKVITPDGSVGGMLLVNGGFPCGAPGDTLRRAFITPHRDQSGRFYQLASNVRTKPDGTFEQTDAAAIERWGNRCGRDTVGFIPRKINPDARILPGGVMIARPSASQPAFPGVVQWIPSPDGRVAIVHPDPYRVDMVDAGGRARTGQVIPFQPVPLSEAHKAWHGLLTSPPSPAIVQNRGGGATRQLMAPPRMGEPEWPNTLPPFLFGALSMGLDGRLWVQRTSADLDTPTFDVFDAAGRLAERVTLPAKSRLVGHGRGVLYVVRIDDDDLEYLERHRLTPAR